MHYTRIKISTNVTETLLVPRPAQVHDIIADHHVTDNYHHLGINRTWGYTRLCYINSVKIYHIWRYNILLCILYFTLVLFSCRRDAVVKKYYWKALTNDIQTYVKSCICQKSKDSDKINYHLAEDVEALTEYTQLEPGSLNPRIKSIDFHDSVKETTDRCFSVIKDSKTFSQSHPQKLCPTSRNQRQDAMEETSCDLEHTQILRSSSVTATPQVTQSVIKEPKFSSILEQVLKHPTRSANKDLTIHSNLGSTSNHRCGESSWHAAMTSRSCQIQNTVRICCSSR